MRGITRPPAQAGSQGYSLVKPDRNTPQPRVFCLKQPIGFRNKIVLSGLKSDSSLSDENRFVSFGCGLCPRGRSSEK